MNRIIFIIPYFGKFNNYFNLFLQSCKINNDLCDWLIFTDDNEKYEYPDNVYVFNMTWDDMVELIQSKFEEKIELTKPYKLCDFKPMYGYIFEEYIKQYNYWGYCDTDLIWGKISKFVTSDILNKYDKIFNLGHCTILKNTFENNNRFRSEFKGEKIYKTVITNKENQSFDEEYGKGSINDIYNELGITIYEKSFAANIYTKSSDFKITYLKKDHTSYAVEKKKRNFFVANNNGLFRYLVKTKGYYIIEEYMYIHLQSRKMNNRLSGKKESEYKIIPNTMEMMELPTYVLNEKNIAKIRTKYFNLHYFRLRLHNLKDKLKRKWGLK